MSMLYVCARQWMDHMKMYVQHHTDDFHKSAYNICTRMSEIKYLVLRWGRWQELETLNFHGWWFVVSPTMSSLGWNILTDGPIPDSPKLPSLPELPVMFMADIPLGQLLFDGDIEPLEGHFHDVRYHWELDKYPQESHLVEPSSHPSLMHYLNRTTGNGDHCFASLITRHHTSTAHVFAWYSFVGYGSCN